ncbi:MAG: hypothetical protein F6K19_42600 [Cyanothece sp. SIO1E1]|nr:hypothetical protein [Cyanothece sp. SIO1E1]
MIDYDDAWILPAELAPNYTSEQFDAAFDAMCLRQSKIDAMMQGAISGNVTRGDIDEALDVLAEQNIDPYAFLNRTEANIKQIIEGSIIVNSYAMV